MTEEQALLEAGFELKASSYQFTAITPESHRRVLERNLEATDLRGIFGWNQPFSNNIISGKLLKLLQQANALRTEQNNKFSSRVRFATLHDQLYLHSGFPTLQNDAVFFGPDSYRYVRWLRHCVEKAHRVVDIGSGSGVGALSIADRAEQLCLADINPLALKYSRINARLSGVDDRVETVYSDVLQGVQGPCDLIISNPPYMFDAQERAYRHGGKLWGAELSVRITREGLERLASGGKLVLYTASAVVNGVDTFWQAVQPLLNRHQHDVVYEEIDPDVFGEELDSPAYQEVERIAVVGLMVRCK